MKRVSFATDVVVTLTVHLALGYPGRPLAASQARQGGVPLNGLRLVLAQVRHGAVECEIRPVHEQAGRRVGRPAAYN